MDHIALDQTPPGRAAKLVRRGHWGVGIGIERSLARLGLALGLALGVLAGCRVAPPPVTASDASRAHVELADLQRGRALLVSKCGSCHRPPSPTDHGAREWPEKLDEMSLRANLDVVQRRQLEAYLVAMAMR